MTAVQRQQQHWRRRPSSQRKMLLLPLLLQQSAPQKKPHYPTVDPVPAPAAASSSARPRAQRPPRPPGSQEVGKDTDTGRGIPLLHAGERGTLGRPTQLVRRPCRHPLLYPRKKTGTAAAAGAAGAPPRQPALGRVSIPHWGRPPRRTGGPPSPPPAVSSPSPAEGRGAPPEDPTGVTAAPRPPARDCQTPQMHSPCREE